MPFKKRLTVFLFGLDWSRFRRTATTASRNLGPTFFRNFSWMNRPSESKQKLSHPSARNRELPASEKPTLSSCFGVGVLSPVSIGVMDSTIRTSNIYLPDLMPVSDRTHARRYCMPPSVSVLPWRFPSSCAWVCLEPPPKTLHHSQLQTLYTLRTSPIGRTAARSVWNQLGSKRRS